ncbi:MAG: hypothetical protein COB67_09660 [SAR324 cluster bacterium]|uniref:histidine kinase n=1 Tax=SAR324 cluster bacterium TaxID=2024889 RepID=A0A2A4T0S2_9DELT|nr:MAG: hypothetical protein COB67_09660 [SAR324 cluster bacterium]
MNISTKLHLNTIFSLFLVLIVGGILWFVALEVSKSTQKNTAVEELIEGIFEINLLTQNYIRHPRQQMIDQWNMRYESFAGLISNIMFFSESEKSLVEEIKGNYKKLGILFKDLSRESKGELLGTEFIEIQEGQILARLHSMISSAGHLKQIRHQEMRSIQYESGLGIIVLVTLIAFLITINSFLVNRSIAVPIKNLKEKVEQIRGDNFDFQIEEDRNDETGHLSQSFGRMIERLRRSHDSLQNEIYERKKADETILQWEDIFKLTGQPIVVGDSDTPYIKIVNPAFAKMMGYTTEELIGKHLEEVYAPEARPNIPDYMHSSNKKEHHHYESKQIRKDGSIFPVSIMLTTVKDPLGKVKYRIANIDDITEQKATEDELERRVEERTKKIKKMQQKLIQSAQQAGMAEIASGILHNVGNTLNSLSVSSEMITRSLKDSELPSFIRVNQMLDSNRNNLGEFLTQDIKGKQIPNFYNELGKVFMGEQELLIKESETINRLVDLIKEVIRTQQEYAVSVRLEEEEILHQVVDDSLLLQLNSFSTYKIKIIKNYRAIPPITIQRSKLIHILINLLNNAKDALQGNAPENRQIIIEIDKTPEGESFIKIQDNGQGILKEELSNIFAYGYTTKRGGHGFGLHTSAIYMQEMNGRIEVQSEGIGKGASFTLTLPCQSQN